ncbi:MAG: hypothetical protein LBI42_01275 [Chitinispirillales bacterium]|jgi:hypothetical protein|nr:hypothetical protein [Chitinispirillales bacterium]
MNRTGGVVLAIFLCIGAAFAQNEGSRPKIAVCVTGEIGENEKKILSVKILTGLVQSGRYRAVEQGEAFFREFQNEQDNPIDDNLISRLGKQYGVQVICIADVTPAFGSNHISARIVDVETAEVVAMSSASSDLKSMNDVDNASKKIIASILDKTRSEPVRVKASAPQSAHAGYSESEPSSAKARASYESAARSQPQYYYENFTGIQRLGTWVVNTMVPGVGSFAIMNDNVGGWTQAGLFFGGLTLFIYGAGELSEGSHFSEDYSGHGELAIWLGFGCWAFNSIYNIVRSCTYNKPDPNRRAYSNAFEGFNLAVMPDKQGEFKTMLLYNKTF